MAMDSFADRILSLRNPHFTLDPFHTALVIIDMQYVCASRSMGIGPIMKEKVSEEQWEYRFGRIENVIVPNISRLLEFFRENGLRVIYVTLGSEMPDCSDIFPHNRQFVLAIKNIKGHREHEILDEIKPLPGECVVNKLTSGAFNSSNIDIILRAMDIKHLLFTGVVTNSCVEATARDAADRGYRCIIVDDCCGAAEEALHNATLAKFRTMGRVSMTDEVIAELSGALSK
ncbi:MAG: cysteine hydrolase [Chloroflexi bacterium]|nr:cysteine hydrolase [Chloroflexota bacterium]